jgi:phosphohistidine swiveling domain-containing protein
MELGQISLKKLKSIDQFHGKNSEILEKLEKADKELLKANIKDQFIDKTGLSHQLNALVLKSDDIAAIDSNLTGGKGSSLAILNAIKNVSVPDFFCVTTKAFRDLIEYQSKNLQKLEELGVGLRKSETQQGLNALFKQAGILRDLIEKADIPLDIIDAIKKAYNGLCVTCHTKDIPVAVRSSATTEDTKEASFAGQHDTFLGQRGEDDVVKSVRRCWASIFTDRAVEYRYRNFIPHEKALMSVVVQVMVNPAVAGTSFSVEISTGFPAAHVAASYGLGEAVVSGEVTSDEWLVDPRSLNIIKNVIGSKKSEYIMLNNGSGTEIKEVSLERRQKLCMSNENVLSVARATLNIQKVYNKVFEYENVDTEFAINEKGEVKLLQSRPVVAIKTTEILTVDKKSVMQGMQVVKSSYSLIGAVTGRCKIIYNFEDLVEGKVSIEPDDILVTAKTSNYWNQYLTSLRGIVTVDGSPTAHPMLIGRERNLTVLCGIPDLLERCQFLNGKIITIDGLTKWLYNGEIKLIKASNEEMQNQFVTQKIIDLKGEEETVKFLNNYDRLITVNEGDSKHLYVRNPNTKLSPAWIKIYGNIYKARFPLVNSCRTTKLASDPLSNIIKTIDGYNADLLVSSKQTISVFEGMTLEDCQAYHDAVDAKAKEYLSACDAFRKNPSSANWKNYIKTYAPLYASLWLSYFWRTYLKKISSSIANSIDMASFHYNEMLQQVQEQMGNLEEDSTLHKNIVKLAGELRPSVLSQKETNELEIKGRLFSLSLKTIVAISMMKDDLKARVNQVAESYRLHKNSDISLETPSALVVELITEAIQLGQTNPNDDDGSDQGKNVTYYPLVPTLSKAINLLMYSRLQNSNCHHFKIRGQWQIRHGLIKVAKSLNINLEDILKIEDPNDIEKLIIRYENQLDVKTTNAPAAIGYTSLVITFVTGLAAGFILKRLVNKK